MTPSDGQIVHVSDTALMVAACRAMETARPDGLVRDPFAERLAGVRGMAIARALPGMDMMCFGIGIRSHFLDDLVAHTIAAQGIDTVVSFGCGLDTRPWRLDFPADLHWLEVDFPAMLDYKVTAMALEKPHCRLDHVAADLTDESQRHAVFAAAGNASGLMITEGLLMYLAGGTVEALATESVARSGIRYWLLDLTSPELNRRTEIGTLKAIQDVRAENHLNGIQILEVLRRSGWMPIRHRSYIKDAMEVAGERIRVVGEAHRKAGTEHLPPPPADDPSGVYLFGRE